MAKRPVEKNWITIEGHGRKGRYEVSGGTLTLETPGHPDKVTRAPSSTGMPSSMGTMPIGRWLF